MGTTVPAQGPLSAVLKDYNFNRNRIHICLLRTYCTINIIYSLATPQRTLNEEYNIYIQSLSWSPNHEGPLTPPDNSPTNNGESHQALVEEIEHDNAMLCLPAVNNDEEVLREEIYSNVKLNDLKIALDFIFHLKSPSLDEERALDSMQTASNISIMHLQRCNCLQSPLSLPSSFILPFHMLTGIMRQPAKSL